MTVYPRKKGRLRRGQIPEAAPKLRPGGDPRVTKALITTPSAPMFLIGLVHNWALTNSLQNPQSSKG